MNPPKGVISFAATCTCAFSTPPSRVLCGTSGGPGGATRGGETDRVGSGRARLREPSLLPGCQQAIGCATGAVFRVLLRFLSPDVRE
eukprot:1897503-Prymnesium_polylepis.1